MKHSISKGFSFGLTSGIITTLGLIVGLNSSTHSIKVVLGGILVIAVADAMSDAFGIHMSEESENTHTQREVWTATISTFLTKFVFALTFLVPILLLPLEISIIISVIWGLLLICIFSLYVAQKQGSNSFRAVSEHLIIALVVIVLTHLIGDLIANKLG